MMAVVKGIAAAIYVLALLYGGGVIFGWGFWTAMPEKIKVELVPKERADE